MKGLLKTYNKLSNFGKVLLFVALLLALIVFFKGLNNRADGVNREGYEQNDQFLFKKGHEVYDDFYATIYDYLVFNNMKDDFEISQIVNKTNPTSESLILDIGSGTGHHVAKLSNKGLNVIGLDISPAMVKEAKTKFPEAASSFKVGDALNLSEFRNNSFTHIMCMYFTIYYFKNKRQFFNNCMEWLMPGGYLILHVVDRAKFDPILPPGNPLYVVSPQKYAKERITKTKVTFNEFVYNSNFSLDESKNIAVFEEKFKFNDGKVRKQEQMLYMEDDEEIVSQATDAGFVIQGKIDLIQCAYDHQYLYILVKPA
jgi:ubiquinone/menaquinone biosynthesis C-methylase UbiE